MNYRNEKGYWFYVLVIIICYTIGDKEMRPKLTKKEKRMIKYHTLTLVTDMNRRSNEETREQEFEQYLANNIGFRIFCFSVFSMFIISISLF